MKLQESIRDSFHKCAAMKWCWLFLAALSVCSTDERVISSHKDGTVKVWNLTPNEVATNEEHTVGHRSDYHQITAMTFNGDWMIAGKQSFPSFWLTSKCLVCCQHIHSWSGMWELIWYIIYVGFVYCWMQALFWYPFHCWAVQVLYIVTKQGGGRCYTIHSVKIAVNFAKICCAATTMALTSVKRMLTRMSC